MVRIEETWSPDYNNNYYDNPLVNKENLQLAEENWFEEPDVCYDTAFSILFFILVTLIGVTFGVYAIVLYLKRRNNLYYGFDILHILLFIAAFIKFCPTIWHHLSTHQSIAPGTSQAGCKLMAYTLIGMSHVITFLVVCLVLYFWVGGGLCPVLLKKMSIDFGTLDNALRHHLGWFILLIFALEGVTGLAPAMYMDVMPDEKTCNATQSPDFTATHFVAAHSLLQVIVPYLLPFVLTLYPLVSLAQNLHAIEDQMYRSAAKTTIIVATSYMVTYTPLAIMLLGIFPAFLGGSALEWNAICVIEGIFTFFQDIWFLYIPIVVMLRDPELGKKFPGKEIVTKFLAEKLSLGGNIFNADRSQSNPRHNGELQEDDDHC